VKGWRNMKLFLKEHALLIGVQIIQFTLILAIYWLDGYRHLLPALYGIFLGLFFLTAYLAYHYASRRKFYQRLTEELASLDDSFQTTENSPISRALDDLLKGQYRHYQTVIKALESRQEEHLKFMDQWVHQMKTPLSVIELIAQNLDEPDSSSIREETDRMKTGLNTILYMARLRTIEQDFHIKPVHLSKIIHEVNGENKRFYIRNGVYPNLIQDKQDMIVETDEKWLFFMLSQLINNAVKYSRGKSNRIDIAIFEKNGEAVIEVKDYGVGIPEADKRVAMVSTVAFSAIGTLFGFQTVLTSSVKNANATTLSYRTTEENEAKNVEFINQTLK
jgi:two-component system, OmpR family, sensor histidine kinase YxdK